MVPLLGAGHIPKGGVAPIYGRKLRSGVAAPAAMPQLQDSQAHKGALARTWKWRFGAHAPRCLMCTRRSAPTLADPRSKSASREPSRAPCREAVDHRSGSRGSVDVVQLDDPLEAGLQVAILLEHPVILGADGLLDSGDLAASRTVGFRNSGGAGCCRCVGPVLEDRQGPLELPHGADDGHDLDGSAALPQRFPEAAMCPRPRSGAPSWYRVRDRRRRTRRARRRARPAT